MVALEIVHIAFSVFGVAFHCNATEFYVYLNQGYADSWTSWQNALGLFSIYCTIFSSMRFFSAVGVFSPEEGVGPPPLNSTHLAPATDWYTCTCHISMQSLLLCLVVMDVVNSRRTPMLNVIVVILHEQGGRWE